jgi:hypothetical protein
MLVLGFGTEISENFGNFLLQRTVTLVMVCSCHSFQEDARGRFIAYIFARAAGTVVKEI